MSLATVEINGRAVTAERGTLLSALLTDTDHGLSLPCGGHGRCGKCRVTASGSVGEVTDRERALLSAEDLARGVRLACLTVIQGDCRVTTEAVVEGRICTDGDMPPVALRPAFSTYGAAVDLGTTTIVARLFDKEGERRGEVSRYNPQAPWGADVISRMEAAVKGEGEAISRATLAALDDMMADLAHTAGISPKEIDGLVITGNTAMLHLLTGTSPEPLTHAPFKAERLFGECTTARALGLTVPAPHGEVYLPPCIGGFVGADTVTALLASEICDTTETRLLVDIGTNGEMVLWHEGGLYACSTAAGPAFEGVGVSMGMMGGEGAIDHVSLCNGTLLAHVIGNGVPRGICGSGIVDAIACLLDNEALDETGYLEDETVTVAAPVALTQADIRAVQLAKSAIYAGIRTLLRKRGAEEGQVEALVLAGGFGSYLDVRRAGRIGLLPQGLVPCVRAVGNAALTGAAMLLLDQTLRKVASTHARAAETVDLATDPVFANEYMMGMYF